MADQGKAPVALLGNQVAGPGDSSLISPLRAEIVESEKARMDFLKHKLLAVADGFTASWGSR